METTENQLYASRYRRTMETYGLTEKQSDVFYKALDNLYDSKSSKERRLLMLGWCYISKRNGHKGMYCLLDSNSLKERRDLETLIKKKLVKRGMVDTIFLSTRGDRYVKSHFDEIDSVNSKFNEELGILAEKIKQSD